MVADRLVAGVRPSDALARFGGDEFTVLLQRIASSAEAESVGRRLVQRLAEPLQLDGVALSAGASIGIALGDHTADDDALLREADAAMYRAKLLGGGRIEISTDLLSNGHSVLPSPATP